MAASFAENKGAKLTLEVDSIRFLTPDVAREEGRSIVKPPNGPPVLRRRSRRPWRRPGRCRRTLPKVEQQSQGHQQQCRQATA